jgi:uncharacterized membrane protein YhaH (DUF805 family)
MNAEHLPSYATVGARSWFSVAAGTPSYGGLFGRPPLYLNLNRKPESNQLPAVRHVFAHYADFRGRASREEFLGWRIFCFALLVIACTLATQFTGQAYFAAIFTILLFLGIPSLALAVRRLHDIGKSGWHMLWLLTGVGVGYVWFLHRQPTNYQPNRFGDPEPLFAVNERS